MIDLLAASRYLTAVSIALCLMGLALHMRTSLGRRGASVESPPKGSWKQGVAYAFTLGMAPWAKESARLHLWAYLRGITFHLGVFTALGVLLAYLFDLPPDGILATAGLVLTGIGGLAGILAVVARVADPKERAVNFADDYAAVAIVTLFVVAAFLLLVHWIQPPPFFLIASIMLLYIPFSKIRHSIYFFFCRFFFGRKFGRRGIIGQGRRAWLTPPWRKHNA